MKKTYYSIFVLLLFFSCGNKETTADFSFSPNGGNTGTEITFDASESVNADSYRWDFDGDGTWDTPSGSSSTKTHTYTEQGTFDVMLEVSSDDGDVATISKSITIQLGTSPAITSAYYVIGKANGNSWLNAQSGNTGYIETGGGTGCILVPFTILVDFNSGVTDNKIYALNGNDLPYDASTGTSVYFNYEKDGVTYLSSYADDQNGSEFKVTSVTSAGLYLGFAPSFKVEGTFKCKLNNEDATNEIEITEGKFSIRLVNTN